MVKTRRFDGKIYRPYDWRDTKVSAEKCARDFRESKDGSARVVKADKRYLVMVRYRPGK